MIINEKKTATDRAWLCNRYWQAQRFASRYCQTAKDESQGNWRQIQILIANIANKKLIPFDFCLKS